MAYAPCDAGWDGGSKRGNMKPKYAEPAIAIEMARQNYQLAVTIWGATSPQAQRMAREVKRLSDLCNNA